MPSDIQSRIDTFQHGDYMSPDDALQLLRDLIAEREKIASKLPHTADHVTITPGMTVYRVDDNRVISATAQFVCSSGISVSGAIQQEWCADWLWSKASLAMKQLEEWTEKSAALDSPPTTGEAR